MSTLNRYQFEYPEEAGNPDGTGTLNQDQIVLIDEVVDDPHALEIDFYVVNDEKNGVYEAIVGDTEIAGVPYDVAGDGRIVLSGTSVYPPYRNQGVETALIRRLSMTCVRRARRSPSCARSCARSSSTTRNTSNSSIRSIPG